MRTLFAVLLMLLSMSCGSDDGKPEAWGLDQPDDGAAGENAAEPADDECVTDADCGEDNYCYKPETCGGARFCHDEYPPISAAPPIDVCSCDGTINSVNHGYPGPFRWELGFLADGASYGAPCDPDAQPPFEYDIEFFLPAPEAAGDAQVHTRLSGSLDTPNPERPRPADGLLRYTATGDQYVSFHVDVLIDRDGDGACSAGDTTERYYAYPDFDLEAFTVRGDLMIGGQPPQDQPCFYWD